MTFVLTKTGAEVFAPTDGSGNPRGAVMSEAATLLTELEAQLRGVVVGSGSLAFETLADLNAALDYDENQKAEVRADGANNGIYAKVGASGGGSWLYLSPLSDAIALPTDNRFLAGAGNLTLSGANNTGAGVAAVDSLTTGNRNTALGGSALSAATTADDGTAIGYGALINATGIRNTAAGSAAGGAITTGEGNTHIGYGAGASGSGQEAAVSYSTAIGYNAYTTSSNQIAFPDVADEVRMFGTTYMRGYLSKRAWFIGEGAGNRSIAPGGGAAVGFGSVALAAITTGGNLVAIGDYAMNAHTTAQNSTAVGAKSQQVGNLTDCTSFGSLTLRSAVSGVGDTAVGFRALEYATVARNNTALGDSALWLTQGSSNLAAGYRVAEYMAAGDNNIFLGTIAGVNRADGDRNTFGGTGANSFPGVTPNATTGAGAQAAGDDNAGWGYRVLENATGDDNSALGSDAGRSLTTGTGNLFLGHDAGNNGSQKVDATNSAAIGKGSYSDANNQMVLGDGSVTEVLIRSATAKLKINGGQIQFPATQVASSDANCLDDYEEGTTTPTITAASGTFTTVSCALAYTKVGNRVNWEAAVTMTDAGTAAGAIIVPLPFTPAADTSGFGIETAGTLNSLAVRVTGSNALVYTTTGGTTIIATGRLARVGGHFRV